MLNANPGVEIGFGQIDRRFEQAKIPLTRHMVAAWHRFDMRDRFHIQSDKSRLELIVWYFWDYLSGKAVAVPDLPDIISSALLEPVECWGPVPAFFFQLWKSHYQNILHYDIFTEDGYFRFLSEIAYQEARVRCLPPTLTDGDVAEALKAPQPGYAGSYYLTRFLYQRWLSSDVYRQKYINLHDLQVLQTYVFDQVVHSLARDGEVVYPHDQLAWWSTPVHPELPRLSRFLRQLARRSALFSERLNMGWVDSSLYSDVTEWFDTTVLPRWPEFAALVNETERPKANDGEFADAGWGAEKRRMQRRMEKPLLTTSSDEIDVLVIGPYSAASGLGSGVRRSVGALEKLGVNYRIADFYYDSPSRKQDRPLSRAYKGEKLV